MASELIEKIGKELWNQCENCIYCVIKHNEERNCENCEMYDEALISITELIHERDERLKEKLKGLTYTMSQGTDRWAEGELEMILFTKRKI